LVKNVLISSFVLPLIVFNMRSLGFSLIVLVGFLLLGTGCKKAEDAVNSYLQSSMTCTLDGTALSSQLVTYNIVSGKKIITGTFSNGYYLNIELGSDSAGSYDLSGLSPKGTVVYTDGSATNTYTSLGSLTTGSLKVTENSTSKIAGTFYCTITGLSGTKTITNGVFTYKK